MDHGPPFRTFGKFFYQLSATSETTNEHAKMGAGAANELTNTAAGINIA